MKEQQYNDRVKRLKEVAAVIEKLPSEIRSESFELLKSYISDTAAPSGSGKKASIENQPPADTSSKEEFFSRFDHDKPADNVKLIIAWLYSQYGTEPFTTEEIKSEADNIGITIPARPDATISAATEKGKKLFMSAGRGKFKPTVHGESSLKTTYSVKKGTSTRPSSSE